MTYSVQITHQAEKDLRNIYEYIAYTLQSVQNAVAQLGRLKESIYSLNQLPERYRQYEKEPWHSLGWRIMPVDHYCVFCMPDHNRKVVTIIRILYGKMDMETVISNNEKES